MTKVSPRSYLLFLHLVSLSPKVKLVGEYIESELHTKHTGLAEWFKEVELPRIAGFFLPLLKNWSVEYAGRFARRILCF
jgi:hypothetical protein